MTSPAHSVVVEIGGKQFPDWTSIRIVRSLHELSGSFQLEYDDQLRMQATIPRAEDRYEMVEILDRMAVRILVDDELMMTGFIEDVDWEISGDQVRATFAGLDPGGDLMQCSANPEGPAEYKGLTVDEIVRRVVKPFGIRVRVETPVGAPLPDFGIDLGESVISVIDKAVKQRAILVTSDGTGGLVLTTSGSSRAPAPLKLPGNVVSFGAKNSSRERYSDYWVKGQARGGHHRGRGRAPLDGSAHPLPSRAPEGATTSQHSRRPVSAGPLDGTAYPLSAGPTAGGRPSIAAAGRAAIISTGHARDPAVTRYRPRVWVARTQAGGAPNQILAEWRMRLARGRAVKRQYTVAGWRAGDDRRLWRPNELVSVEVGGSGPHDMLIEAVTFAQSDAGSITQLTVVGREAYDLEPLPDNHRGTRNRAARGSDISRGATGRRE